MIVLLQSAGSHLLTLPAVVCLPEPGQKDRRGQPEGSGQNTAGNLPWSHTGETSSPSKTPFGFGCFPVPVFKQLDAEPQFSLVHPKDAGKHPKDDFN